MINDLLVPTQTEILQTISKDKLLSILIKLGMYGEERAEKWSVLSRIDVDHVLQHRIPFPCEKYTNDNKYGIRVKWNGGFIVYELGNPIESIDSTFSGPIEECERYLRNKGYQQSDFIEC
jgi:hypothetical protein